MLNRLIRFSLVSVFALAIAGHGVAYADAHEGGDGDKKENPCASGDEDKKNPCEGGGEEKKNPCEGGETTEGGGDEAGGGDDAGMKHAWKKGAIGIMVDVGVNLSDSLEFKPFSIAPDITYVVSPKLRAVLGHSAQSGGGFYGLTAGSGLCLAGEDNGCANVYDNFQLGADYKAVEGGVNVMAWGRITARSIDGEFFGITAGAAISKALSGGKLMVGANPNLYIGITERDFNKEFLSMPVWAMYAVSPKLMAGVQTGIAGPLDGFGDGFVVPVGVGGMYAVGPKINAGLAFTFANLLGKNSTADARGLSLILGYKL